MRNWTPQILPGLLEDDTPVPLPLPLKTTQRITEALEQLVSVDLPDWYDSGPTEQSLATMGEIVECWAEIMQNIARGILRQVLK